MDHSGQQYLLEELGQQDVIVLADNPSVAEQLNGDQAAPEGANEAYRDALQAGQEALRSANGMVAVIPSDRNLARRSCRQDMAQILVKHVMDEVEASSEPVKPTDATVEEAAVIPRA